VNNLVTHDGPLLVVDAEGKPVGMITGQSALDELTRMKDSE
jgi:predicted transcriptional regulator